jgi:thiosulfate dehydrogenase [quinone] large subunit
MNDATGPAGDWRSDQSIAYAILRFTFGLNIGMRGLGRLMNGTDLFVADLLKQFQNVAMPVFALQAFGRVLPWVETAIGLLLVLGLWTRPALIAGGLMMAALTFGTMLRLDFQIAWLQLTYALIFFVLLAFHHWNRLSVDAARRG